MQDWIMYIVHEFFDHQTTLNFRVASKRYWELTAKHQSTVVLRSNKKGEWRKERPRFLESGDIIRLVIYHELCYKSNDPPLDDIQGFHRLQKKLIGRLKTYWMPSHPRLQHIELRFSETGWIVWSLGQMFANSIRKDFHLERNCWSGEQTSFVWKRIT